MTDLSSHLSAQPAGMSGEVKMTLCGRCGSFVVLAKVRNDGTWRWLSNCENVSSWRCVDDPEFPQEHVPQGPPVEGFHDV